MPLRVAGGSGFAPNTRLRQNNNPSLSPLEEFSPGGQHCQVPVFLKLYSQPIPPITNSFELGVTSFLSPEEKSIHTSQSEFALQ